MELRKININLGAFSFVFGFLRNRENSADVFPGTERRSNLDISQQQLQLPCTIDKKLDYYRPKTKTWYIFLNSSWWWCYGSMLLFTVLFDFFYFLNLPNLKSWYISTDNDATHQLAQHSVDVTHSTTLNVELQTNNRKCAFITFLAVLQYTS